MSSSLSDVDRHGHSRCRLLQRQLHALPHHRPRRDPVGIRLSCLEVGQLHPEEREVLRPPLPPPFPPVADQQWQLVPVEPGRGNRLRVPLALVPDRTPDAVADQRLDHAVVEVGRLVAVGSGFVLPRSEHRRQAAVLFLHVEAGPGLDRRTAPGRVDQPHGDAELGMQTATEEVGRARKPPDRLRAADLPLALAIGLGRQLRRPLDGEHPDLREVGCRLLRLGVAATPDGHRHVALATGQPDLADQHIGDLQRVGRPDDQLVRSPGRHRFQRHLPPPGLIGLGRTGPLADRDGYLLTGRCRAPHRHGTAPLQHHVVGEDGCQPGLAPRRTGPGDRHGQKQHAGQKAATQRTQLVRNHDRAPCAVEMKGPASETGAQSKLAAARGLRNEPQPVPPGRSPLPGPPALLT